MKKFLVIDDHSIVRAGIKLILNRMFPNSQFDEAINEKNSLSIINEKSFDLIFLDLNMPDSDPTTLIYYILNKQPGARIIVLTMNDENVYAKRFFKLGIQGFLNKSSTDTEIENAVNIVLNGQMFISDNLKRVLAESFITGNTYNPFDSLSDREFQVAQELVRGKSITDISIALNIHPSTVSTYKTKVFEKLSIQNNSMVELISVARSFKII